MIVVYFAIKLLICTILRKKKAILFMWWVHYNYLNSPTTISIMEHTPAYDWRANSILCIVLVTWYYKLHHAFQVWLGVNWFLGAVWIFVQCISTAQLWFIVWFKVVVLWWCIQGVEFIIIIYFPLVLNLEVKVLISLLEVDHTARQTQYHNNGNK